jgi:hypothetical protein
VAGARREWPYRDCDAILTMPQIPGSYPTDGPAFDFGADLAEMDIESRPGRSLP